MKNIFDLTFSEIEQLISEFGQPGFRAKQIWTGLYQNYYSDWGQFSTIPKELKQYLENEFSINAMSLVDSLITSDCATQKTLFNLFDDNPVESVLLKNNERLTLCISTQSGCPVGCVFCATGNLGFKRNLNSGEIIFQVIHCLRLLKIEGKTLTNVVIMGMGEPFLNYENTFKAIKLINDPAGLGIGARRITVSTIGIPEKIIGFANQNLQINLSVSLHAPSDFLRQKLVPIAAKYPLSELLDACKYYIEKTNRRITFEYVMISGINDDEQQAHTLSFLIKNMNCHVNLIPLNPNLHYSGKQSPKEKIRIFGRILIDKGIAVSIRDSQGDEIQAGCGQLAGFRLGQ